jgi:hypothetical protein
MFFSEIFQLHDAAKGQISLLQNAVSCQIFLLHVEAERQISPLYNATGSQNWRQRVK